MSPRDLLRSLGQLARFSVVGIVCLAVSTATLAALHAIAGLYYLAAFAISFVVGNALGYLLNGRLTFATEPSRGGMLRYFLLNGALLLINSALMKLLVERAHVWYIGASLLLALVNTPLTFLLHRSVSFATRSARGPDVLS